jgi:hypothetical protein
MGICSKPGAQTLHKVVLMSVPPISRILAYSGGVRYDSLCMESRPQLMLIFLATRRAAALYCSQAAHCAGADCHRAPLCCISWPMVHQVQWCSGSLWRIIASAMPLQTIAGRRYGWQVGALLRPKANCRTGQCTCLDRTWPSRPRSRTDGRFIGAVAWGATGWAPSSS